MNSQDTSPTPSALETIRATMRLDRFAAQMGISIVDAHEGYARCQMAVDEQHRNAMGNAMGGVLFALADFCAATAVNAAAVADGGMPVWVSLDAATSFLTAARGNTLWAEAKILRQGRTTACCHTSVYESADSGETRLVAVVQSNFFCTAQR